MHAEISTSVEGTITSIINDNGLTCTLNNGVITCDGTELAINQLESVLFWVEIDNCPCNQQFEVDVNGIVSAANGDVNYANNNDSYSLNVAEYLCNDCVDPITNLTIDSHTNYEVVYNSPVTLEGTVEGGVDSVIVTVNGIPYTATINGNTWSLIVSLTA
ncbi:MAG: hypothetical protein H6765_09350 [Candidatus Peribacteria bacterium]|nr:MAG: hypothetical protein H6765_09350 [Candidatus Peribacteria bacterium]